MRILVTAKVVLEPEALPVVACGKLKTAGAKRVIDQLDEAILQAAIDMKHAISATKVTAASVGAGADRDVLKLSLAMGADEAVLLKLSNASANALTVAKLIKRLVALENYELVLVGSQSSDNEGSQVGQALASLLGWPHLSKVTKLEWCSEGYFRARCSIDRGNVWFLVRRPCVMVCDARIAKPKLLKLSGLVEAKKKKVKVKAVANLNLRSCASLSEAKYSIPEIERKRQVFADLKSAQAALMECLK
ncbi:MAG: hypothetical protein P3M75_00395 [Candidatus Hodgkinia cicadicola]|nr:MAG: hypothetical protein P3M75_00395 [Candidatus Hodgkinia cicadicola]